MPAASLPEAWGQDLTNRPVDSEYKVLTRPAIDGGGAPSTCPRHDSNPPKGFESWAPPAGPVDPRPSLPAGTWWSRGSAGGQVLVEGTDGQTVATSRIGRPPAGVAQARLARTSMTPPGTGRVRGSEGFLVPRTDRGPGLAPLDARRTMLMVHSIGDAAFSLDPPTLIRR